MERLMEPPSAGDLASAEQALAELSDPPSASGLASAEQAVANALLQISISEEALADLLTGTTEAEIAAARAEVTQAQVQFTSATTHAEGLREDLTEAHEDFCRRYNGFSARYPVIHAVCVSSLPLSDSLIVRLRESFEDASDTYERYGNALIDANVSYVDSDADRDSAHSGLATANARLNELLEPVSQQDLYQAEQAVEAARASHTAAVVRLEERTGVVELEVGQTGVATFDASEGIDYPVRVESISRVPNAEQGVVTFEVKALILTGP